MWYPKWVVGSWTLDPKPQQSLIQCRLDGHGHFPTRAYTNCTFFAVCWCFRPRTNYESYARHDFCCGLSVFSAKQQPSITFSVELFCCAATQRVDWGCSGQKCC